MTNEQAKNLKHILTLRLAMAKNIDWASKQLTPSSEEIVDHSATLIELFDAEIRKLRTVVDDGA